MHTQTQAQAQAHENELTERNECMNKTIHGIHKSVSFTVFTWTPLRGLNRKQFHAFHSILHLARATMSNGHQQPFNHSFIHSNNLVWIYGEFRLRKVRAFFGVANHRCKHVNSSLNEWTIQQPSNLKHIEYPKYFIHILMLLKRIYIFVGAPKYK